MASDRVEGPEAVTKDRMVISNRLNVWKGWAGQVELKSWSRFIGKALYTFEWEFYRETNHTIVYVLRSDHAGRSRTMHAFHKWGI